MSTNKTTYPFMSVQMFYDIQHFSDSLGCDRGPKLRVANFMYDGGSILHVKYDEVARCLDLKIFE